MTKHRRTRLVGGLRRRIIVSFVVVTIAVAGALSAVLSLMASSMLRQDLRERLLATVGVVATAVDPAEHATLRTPADQEGESYGRIRGTLRTIQGRIADAEFVYTMRENDKGEVVFVVDASDGADMSNLGDVYTEATDTVRRAVRELKEPYVEKEFYTDRWGTFLSAYAPILLPDGRIDGVIGIDVSLERVLAIERRYLLISLAVFLAASALAVAVGSVTGGRLAAPIAALASEADRIAGGDYSFRRSDSRKDEVGALAQAMEKMCVSLGRSEADLRDQMASLEHVLEDVGKGADEVYRGASAISGASGALSDGSRKQADSVRRISASMTEIDRETQANAGRAAQASSIAKEAKAAADQGASGIDETVRSMDAVSESAGKIREIITVIDGIAFQTNILALNAAVEAARAGAAGKGFAVVADEVRNLATRSAQAAEETARLIGRAVGGIAEGTRIAQAAAAAFGGIRRHNEQLLKLIDQIAVSGQGQAIGITGISHELAEIDAVTQQSASSASDAASQAADLSDEAGRLRALLQTGSKGRAGEVEPAEA